VGIGEQHWQRETKKRDSRKQAPQKKKPIAQAASSTDMDDDGDNTDVDKE
jgi:hypothetical protein